MRAILFSLLFTLSLNLYAETHLILVRHGETDWNQQQRLQGHADIPLNEAGEAQAQQFAEKVAVAYPDIQAIYSSDLQRAYMTAYVTAEKFHLPVHQKPNLRELDWGEWDGLSISDPRVQTQRNEEKQLAIVIPDREMRWNIPLAPGAESNNQLVIRLKKELLEIAQAHANQTILVFTHGRAMRTFLFDILNSEEPFFIGNCEMAHVLIHLENKAHPFSFLKLENFLKKED